MDKGFMSLFIWGRKTPSNIAFLKGMMLFNLFFFCENFGVLPYFFIVLQLFAGLYYIRYLSIKGIFSLKLFPKIVCICLLIWTLYILRNGFSSLHTFSHTVFLPYNYVCLFMPFILIPFAKIEYLSEYVSFTVKTVKFSTVLLVIMFPLMVSRWGDLSSETSGSSMQFFEVINLYLNGGLMFLMIMLRLLSPIERRWIYISALISMFCAAFFARRGVLLSYVVTFCFMGLISIKTLPDKKKFAALIAFGLLFLILALFFFAFQDSLFSILMGRINDDTRSGVELELLDQMLGTGEFYTGRGIAGSYSSILIDGGFEMEREGIETGYLHLILKGGIVYLVLMFLLTIPPVILGIFKSKNEYMKMLACFCLIFVVFFNVASSNITFSIRYFLFLISMYILYNPKYRKMSNNEIRDLLYANKA